MSETETGLARRIASGAARSPTATDEYTWFALRWSGTDADGAAWRAKFNEHVQRPAALTLTPEMCDRLAGVPLVFLHPTGGDLDSKAFEQSIIGTLAFGFIATPEGVEAPDGTELWAMARVYDAAAIAALSSGTLSTSPSVTFSPQAGNEAIKLADGSHVLREGVPGELSHLAIVGAGVWDRGGAPSGVRIDPIVEDQAMTEEEKKAAEEREARRDAQIDKVLSHLNDVGKRLDGLEKTARAADADHERAAWMAEDAAQCARDDAEEESEREKLERAGEAKQVAADKARTARRDRVQARRDAQRRHDSAQLSNAQAAALRADAATNAEIQARADRICQSWGESAPPPMSGETPSRYRVRMLRQHQRHCGEPSFRDLDLAALAETHPTALDGIEKRIYADSVAASAHPELPGNRMLARTRIDAETGHRVTEFFGRPTIFKQFSPAPMYATKWHVRRSHDEV